MEPQAASGALLVVGATSGAGKSTVTAGLCRLLHRRGLVVAPFKAQNMSNHAAVTADGGEIGRAQAMQAAAAGIDFDRRMNPVLLKPNSHRRSHVVVLGDEQQTTDAQSYGEVAQTLKPVVLGALDSLRNDVAWVIAEGAGGAAEINLLARDLVNLPLANAAGIPALLVVDIDRGGAFASAFGTIEILPPELRSTIVGIAFNQFRGDPTLLADGNIELERRTGVPVLGVLPHLGDAPMLGVEDSLDVNASPSGTSRFVSRAASPRPVRVAVIHLPHLANPSDFDPFLIEPDVSLNWVTRAEELEHADLVIVPGSRATVDDLAWLRSSGIGAALEAKATREDGWIVGICAGYQMLGQWIDDPIESGNGRVDGLGLLPATTTFAEPKIVCRSEGSLGERALSGYQIRFGRPTPSAAGHGWLHVDGAPEGTVLSSRSAVAAGAVAGTSLHGLFDSDEFRAGFLAEVAAVAGREYSPGPLSFAEALDSQHDQLADWLEEHMDTDALLERASHACAPGEGPGW